MTRRDFTLTLYNNGKGLTLDQIADIDGNLIDTVPDGVIEDYMESGSSEEQAIILALDDARSVYIDNLHDFTDPLDFADYIRISCGYEVPDENIIGLFYATC